MFTTITNFALPHAFTHEEARAAFMASVPKFRETPGLLRKFYLLAEDGLSAGGVYLWRSREDAERLFTPEWHDFVRNKYGSDASIGWFASPIVLDNVAGETQCAD